MQAQAACNVAFRPFKNPHRRPSVSFSDPLTDTSNHAIITRGRYRLVTPEQRLDRLERIAKLFVRSGLRARRNMRELDEKMNILIDAQIQNEERFAKFDKRFVKSDERFAKFDDRFVKSDKRFAKFEERFAKFDDRFVKSDERFAKFEELLTKSDERFIKFEAQTDQTVKALIELVRQRRNGGE